MTLSDRELSLKSDTNVLGYVQAQNAERNAQAKAEGWSFWTTMPECEDFLAEYANVYELELMYARGTYSDVHKEWSGIRPHSNYSRMSLEELEGEIAWMSRSVEESIVQERIWLEEQKQMERDQIALGLTDSMSCGEEVELEEWEVYEAKAESEGY